MSLRNLPLTFHGELSDIRLVQFSLDPKEARLHLPPQLSPLIIRSRALVSLVDVSLKRMRPSFVPPLLGVAYRHIAFRMLIDDSCFSRGRERYGIFFVRSFAQSRFITLSAALLTHYRLCVADISDFGESVQVQGVLDYSLWRLEPALRGDVFRGWEEAREIVGAVDRAYAVDGKGRVLLTQILRPEWPIEPADLESFSTSFFSSARPECGFRIERSVPYTWLPPLVVS